MRKKASSKGVDILREDGPEVEAIMRQQWSHEQRLFEIERTLKEVAADVRDIKLSASKIERINDALLAMQVHNAKAMLAAADLRDEVVN